MLHAREAGRPPPLAAALLMLVWANLHASYILGLFIASIFALEALIAASDRRAVLIGWGRFGTIALVAAMLTPHGPAGLLYPLMVSRMTTLDLITEWEATDLTRHLTISLPLALVLVVLFWRRVRVPPLRLLMLGLFLYMAMAHVRHHQVLAITGSLLLAAPLGRSFGAQALARPVPRLGLALLAAFVAMAGWRLQQPDRRPESTLHPATAIAALPADLRRQPVLNEYGMGGSLILAGIKPYIDGRADVYGDDFMRADSRINRGDIAALNREAEKWGITWTIFSPQTPIVARLDADPGWQRRYADRWAVVHVRKPPAA